jgi:uncharacterized protein (DUF302 family)
VDIAPQVILGACRPPLAHAALQAEPSIGLLLPDPAIMVSVTGNPDLQAVATEARTRLTAALHSLQPAPPPC